MGVGLSLDPGYCMWLWLWILDTDGGDSLFDEACSIRHGGESVAFVGISAVIAMEGGSEVGGWCWLQQCYMWCRMSP